MAVTESISKTCSSCKETKPIFEFSKRSDRPCGIVAECKLCMKKRYQDWRKKNPDKRKQINDRWIQNNPDRPRQLAKEWGDKNREQKRNNYSRWARDNIKYLRIKSLNRRLIIKERGKLSTDIVIKLLKLQKGKCACCHSDITKSTFHVDHIMPIALGGSNTDNNVQILCASCNYSKHAKHPVDFMQQRGFLL